MSLCVFLYVFVWVYISICIKRFLFVERFVCVCSSVFVCLFRCMWVFHRCMCVFVWVYVRVCLGVDGVGGSHVRVWGERIEGKMSLKNFLSKYFFKL